MITSILAYLRSTSLDDFDTWAVYNDLLMKIKSTERDDIFAKLSDEELIDNLIVGYFDFDDKYQYDINYEDLLCENNIEYVIDMALKTRDYVALVELNERELDEIVESIKVGELIKKNFLQPSVHIMSSIFS